MMMHCAEVKCVRFGYRQLWALYESLKEKSRCLSLGGTITAAKEDVDSPTDACSVPVFFIYNGQWALCSEFAHAPGINNNRRVSSIPDGAAMS